MVVTCAIDCALEYMGVHFSPYKSYNICVKYKSYNICVKLVT